VRFDLLSTTAAIFVVSPLLVSIMGWWKILMVAPLAVWNRLSRERAHEEAQFGREPVSGLLNRQGLDLGMKELTRMDVGSSDHPRPFGIVVVSADALLTINRNLGRDMYERVARVVSRRMIDTYGQDRVARLTGEGVVILMPDLTEGNALEQAQKAAAVLSGHIDVDDVPFRLDPAVGVALSPQHGRELTTLLLKAELAVSEARRQDVPAVLYVRAAAEVAQRRVEIIRELRAVLRDPARWDEIAVLYQPQVDLDAGRLTGVEALLRWTHPQWGLVPTDELIESIEPSEVMHMLTRHMLEVVTAQLRRWNDKGLALRAAVNVSVRDLHEPHFVDELGELIRRQDIRPAQLTIEITERTLIKDAERVAHVATALTGLGVALSLDDFGTGYASLQQLRLLPLGEVKIDRSYIANLVDNAADLAIVTSVHELARALHVNVVAEGVEDRRTASALGRLPGIIGQGYYFGKPMTVDALRNWRFQPEPE
jgi:diguanylate cyclase (GGDEF)-like protein